MPPCEESHPRPFHPDPGQQLYLSRLGSNTQVSPIRFELEHEGQLWPSELSAGRRWMLPDASGTLALRGESGTSWTAVNDSGSTIQAGQPVRLHSDGTLRLAQADSLDHAALGIVVAQVAQGASMQVMRVGPLELPDWTAVVGASNLVPNTRYALVQSVAGKLATTWPGGSGDVQQFCGQAVSTTVLLVDVAEPIQM